MYTNIDKWISTIESTKVQRHRLTHTIEHWGSCSYRIQILCPWTWCEDPLNLPTKKIRDWSFNTSFQAPQRYFCPSKKRSISIWQEDSNLNLDSIWIWWLHITRGRSLCHLALDRHHGVTESWIGKVVLNHGGYVIAWFLYALSLWCKCDVFVLCEVMYFCWSLVHNIHKCTGYSRPLVEHTSVEVWTCGLLDFQLSLTGARRFCQTSTWMQHVTSL